MSAATNTSFASTILDATREAVRTLFSGNSVSLNPEKVIETMTNKEVNFWLEAILRNVCNECPLNYDEFQSVMSENRIPNEKIGEVSEIFTTIINKSTEENKEKIIKALNLTSETFLTKRKKDLQEQKMKIAKTLICTIAVAFIVCNIVSAAIALTTQLIKCSVIGLVGYAAANKLAPDQTAYAIDKLKGPAISTIDTAKTAATKTASKIKDIGLTEKLRNAVWSCMQNATLNPITWMEMIDRYNKLTGATSGAERLIALAESHDKNNKPGLR